MPLNTALNFHLNLFYWALFIVHNLQLWKLILFQTVSHIEKSTPIREVHRSRFHIEYISDFLTWNVQVCHSMISLTKIMTCPCHVVSWHRKHRLCHSKYFINAEYYAVFNLEAIYFSLGSFRASDLKLFLILPQWHKY